MTDQRTRTGVDQVVTDDRGAGRLPGRPWWAFGPATASALMVLFLGLAVFTQAAIDRTWTRRKVERLLYLPKSEHLRLLTLGFDEVAADYFWLRTIGYFGGQYMADKRYPWLAHILQLVTDLDPRFSIVYYFGGIVLAMEAHQVDESNALLAKGMRHLPDNWKFPFFIGFNHFFFKGDFLAASGYIEQAARLPGIPGTSRDLPPRSRPAPGMSGTPSSSWKPRCRRSMTRTCARPCGRRSTTCGRAG